MITSTIISNNNKNNLNQPKKVKFHQIKIDKAYFKQTYLQKKENTSRLKAMTRGMNLISNKR